MTKYLGKRYFTTSENVNATLKEYSVAIIPSLLDEDECKAMKREMWDYLETITSSFETPMNRKDKTTWKEYRKLFPKHSMLLQQWQVGHCQMLWNLRQNPKIYNVFCSIYNVEPEELLVSFDGASFHFPPEITGGGYRRNVESGWLHCDQSFQRNRFECVQGWITANDVEQGDATLIFMEGSHRFHKKFKEHFKLDEKVIKQSKSGKPMSLPDWFKLEEQHIQWYKDQGCKVICIKCPKGSLVLWDSRTIHSGTEPLKGRENPKIRCVGYMCYMPRSRATAAMLKKKRLVFEGMRTTSHWPCKPKLFPKIPRTYGAPLPTVVEIDKPTVDRLGLIMAGF